MKRLSIIFGILFAASVCLGSTTTSLYGDQIKSPDKTKTWALPAVGGTLLNAGAVGSSDIVDGSIVNADINNSAAIAYSKLALTGSILNADLAGSIAWSKIATGNNYRLIATGAAGVTAEAAAITASRALVSDANGIPTHSTVTTTELGYLSGGTQTIQTALDAKVLKSTYTAKGSILAATAASTPANLAVGSDNQVLVADSSQTAGVKWSTINTSGINYISGNPDAESSTTGWANYANTVAGTSPDAYATGGSPVTAIARSTTTPLRGTASFELAKSAANRQGEGTSYAFTIDSADKGQPLQISFNYEITSGTYADGDVRIYIIDVTNSRVIEPDVRDLKATSIKNVHVAKFQASSDSTSYRLAFHIASTSAVAYTVHWDTVKVSPELSTRGANISDWKSVTVTGLMNTNTTYTAHERLVGDSAEYQIKVAFSGAPNATTLDIDLPTGRTIDSSKFTDASTSNFVVGYGAFQDASSGAVYAVTLRYIDSNTVRVVTGDAAGTFTAWASSFNATTPVAIAASDVLDLRLSVPLTGQSAGVDFASDAGDGRTVTVIAYGQPATSANAPIKYSTVSKDTHGAYSTSTGLFTAPFADCFDVKAGTDGSFTAGNGIYAAVAGATAASATSPYMGWEQVTNLPVTGSALVCLNQGQTLSVNPTSALGAGSSNGDQLMITSAKRSSSILAGQTVAAKYQHGASQSITSGGSAQIIDFATKVYDYTGAVTTGASWKYSASVSGLYSVCAAIVFNSGGGWAAAEDAELDVYKGGVFDKAIAYFNSQATHTSRVAMNGCSDVRLLQGEYIDIRLFQSSGAAITLLTSGGNYNYVDIKRVGNY